MVPAHLLSVTCASASIITVSFTPKTSQQRPYQTLPLMLEPLPDWVCVPALVHLGQPWCHLCALGPGCGHGDLGLQVLSHMSGVPHGG